MPEWVRIACEKQVVHRAVACAVVVGAVLVAINHGDALLRGDIPPGRAFRIGLTVLVPYLVSTYSSVKAIREFRQ